MKSKLFLIVMILLIPVSIGAEWIKADTGREVLFEALHLVDWHQTLEIASNDKYTERNPILGKYPSKSEVHLYMGAVLILHPVVSYLLPDKWREGWQYLSIGATGSCVYFNFVTGIR